jgi:hypothetical protein
MFGIQFAATTINGVQEVRVLFNMRELCAGEGDGSTVLYLALTMEGAQLLDRRTPYCWGIVKCRSGRSVSVCQLVCVRRQVSSGLWIENARCR